MKKCSRLAVIALAALLMTGCQKNQEPDEIELGTTALQQESYEQALGHFQKAASEKENLIRVYRGQGMAYMGLGQYEEAVTAFDQALAETMERQKKTRKDILYYQASACYHLEQYEKTIEICNEILNLSTDADAFYLRGTCYLSLGKEDNAQVDFEAALKQAPEDYDIYLNIYESYKDQKQSAKGDEYLQRALQIEGDEEYSYGKARIYYCLENYDEAQKQLSTLVSENDPEALLLMGKVYLAQDKPEESIAMYRKYLEENDATPEIYNGMVLADLAKEDYDAALADVAKGLALEDEAGKQSLYFNEIVVYERMGDFSTAKEKAVAYVLKYPADEQGKKENEFLLST